MLTGTDLQRASYADGAFTLTSTRVRGAGRGQAAGRRGRIPNLDDLGLETVGLDPAARTLDVDERLRAGEKLWAIERHPTQARRAFTHVSMYQSARSRSRDILSQDGPSASYHAVPHATFTRSGGRRGRHVRAAGPRRR